MAGKYLVVALILVNLCCLTTAFHGLYGFNSWALRHPFLNAYKSFDQGIARNNFRRMRVTRTFLTSDEREKDASVTVRKSLWKEISRLEKESIENIIHEGHLSDESIKQLALSIHLKQQDSFIRLATSLSLALEANDAATATSIIAEMKSTGLPPHIQSIVKESRPAMRSIDKFEPEEVDPSSNFSDTVTDHVRIKAHSFFDPIRSDLSKGKYVFWYKVAIYNEGSEPIQVLSRSWDINKFSGEKETASGSGLGNSQPVIVPGDFFAYQAMCPLTMFPPPGRRVLGNISGVFKLCKGNIGQTKFEAKVAQFNLLLPDMNQKEGEEENLLNKFIFDDDSTN